MNAITEMLAQPFVHKLGWTLVHLLWQGAVVALLLAVLLRLLRKSSANVRYLVACSALALVVILPVVTFRLVPAPPSYAPLKVESVSLPPMTFDAAKTVPLNLELSATPATIGLKERAVSLLEPALPYIVIGWALGVFGLSLWHLGGWTHLQRLRRRLTKQADASLLAKLKNLAKQLRVTRPVRLLESAIVQIPTVVGWFRPVILLPATALTGLSEQQLEALLAHELAHIRRADYLINMLQTVVEIFGFYHPAVWWISNKIRIERENCCDDIAVAVFSDKMHYAAALAEMERIRSAQVELAVAANGGNLLMRMHRLLAKSPTPKQRFNWVAALITAAIIAALSIPTSLALSGKYSGNTASEPVVIAASEVTDKLAAIAAVEEGRDVTILFDCKIFELYGGASAPELEPGDNVREGLYVHRGSNYAQRLEKLAKENRNVKLLASPKLLVVEGKEGVITAESEYEYIKGYEDKPGGKSEPIKDTMPDSIELKLRCIIAGNNDVHTQLSFTRLIASFETQKDAQGREVKIPQKTNIECATEVRSADNESFILGGLKNSGEPEHQLMLLITPTVILVEDTPEAAGEFIRETDEPLPSGTAPLMEGAKEKTQILFEFKVFQVPADAKPIKDAAKANGTFVRTDKAFAEQLLELSKTSKDANVLSAPRVLVIEGEEAMFTVSSEIPYISGYSEQPGSEPKPITKTAREGIDVKVNGYTVGDDAIRVRLMFTQITPTLTTHKVAKGREIQIPIVSSTECVTDVTVGNDGVVIIGGLESADKRDQSLVVQMVACIVRNDDEDVPPGPLSISDSSGKISFTVEPQVITSVRADTEDVVARHAPGEGPVRIVERLIKMIKGHALPSFEMLDLKTAVPAQLDDLRKLVGEQSVQIDSVISDDKQALVATTGGLKDDRGREGCLVFLLTRKDGKWTIDDIDFEDPEGLKDEVKRFDEEMRKRRDSGLVGHIPAPAGILEISGEGVFDAVNNLVNLSKGEIGGGVDPKTKKQADELARILGDQKFEVANSRGVGRYALVVSKPIEADGEEGQLVFNLSKSGDKWVIDDIDFESPGGVRDEMKRFNDRSVKAELGAPGMGGFVEAPFDPRSIGLSEKIKPRIYALRHAKAAEVAKALENLLQGSEHKILAEVADEASNRLIVVADGPHYQEIERLIAQLDVAVPEKAEETTTRVFELRNAEPAELADTLNSLLTKKQAETRIITGPGSNQLLIRASKEDLEQMTKLIKLLDVPQAGAGRPAVETVTEVVTLGYADPSEVVTILTSLSVLGGNSRIVSDTRLNQVIVEAPEADLEKIKNLIVQIDRPVDEQAAKRQRSDKDVQLEALIMQREDLAEQMQNLRAKISQMQQDFGITDFAKAEDLALQRAANTMNELAKTESQRAQLESQLNLLQQGKETSASAQERLKMRQEYISADATVKALAERIAQVETELLLAKQTKANDHPEVVSKTNLLKALKERLSEARDEVGQAFDKEMASQAEETRLQNIDRLKAELEQNKVYDQKLRSALEEDNKKGVEMAQSQSRIQALRNELETLKAKYDQIDRRITDIRMEPRPAPTLYDITEIDKE